MQKFSHRKSGCHGTGVRTAEKSDKQHKDRKKTHVKLYLNNKNHLRRAIASEWMKELKVSFRTMAELRAQQQGQRMWEAAIQMPMKNADPAKPSTGQSIRKNTERPCPEATQLQQSAIRTRGWGMWFAVFQMKAAKEAFTMKGRDWKAGNEWHQTIKNFLRVLWSQISPASTKAVQF